MSDWRECKLGEAPLAIIDGDRGKNYPSQNEFNENGFCLFLSTKNVRLDGFDFSDCQFISRERDELLRKGKLQRNDIVLTTRGTVGNIGYYNESVKFENIRINSGMVIIRPDQNYLLPNFNFYLFRKMQNDFHTFISGSAQPQLPIKDMNEIDILLPPLPEQRAIASVLSSLDDKIDLLHRQNKTLEAMAETLFRQWFVEEADEGWEEVTLGDFFPVVTGKKDANFGTDDGLYPFFTCSQNPIKAPEYSFDGSAILLAGNGDFNIKRYVGKFEAYQRTYVLIPSDVTYFGFLYTLMKYYLNEITDGHQGSVINFITKGMITGFSFNLPRDRASIAKKLFRFNQIFEKVDSNTNQIQTLEKIRNKLLPKLMSGEVRVECL